MSMQNLHYAEQENFTLRLATFETELPVSNHHSKLAIH